MLSDDQTLKGGENLKIRVKITGGDKTGEKRRTLIVRIPRLIADDANINTGDIAEMEYQPKNRKIIIHLKEN